MSYRFLAELGEGCLPAPIFSKIAKLSAPSNTKASPSMSSSKDSETDCSPSSPCGTISKHFQGRTGEGTSTSYLRDFLAHRIALLGSRKGQTMSEIFGPTQCPAFAKFDPESLSLRTHPELCPVALSSVSSKTLPKHGMMLGGVCCLLPRPWWERTIYASGGGAERPWLESDGGRSWPTPDASPRGPRAADLVVNDSTVVRRNSGQSRGIDLQTAVRHAEDNPFPTPTSSERSGINPNTGRGSGLSKFVKEGEKFPTPTTQEAKGVPYHGKKGERPRDLTLLGHVQKFPTPTAGDANSAGSRNLEGSKANAGVSLTDKVVYGNSETPREEGPLPTPRASNPGSRPNGKGGKILAEEIMIQEGLRERGEKLDTPREEESWPTPGATDGKGSGKTGEPRDRLDYAVERGETKSKVYDKPPPGGGQLSGDWTDWLVGFPILWSSPDPLPVSAVQEWLAITLLHDWWAEEPPIPRTIERGGDKHRCRRLKGIGNAQVPLCAAVAYTILEIQQEASEA